MDHLPRITELSDTASREFSIEKALDKMVADWEGLAFELGPWKSTGTYILKGEWSRVDLVKGLLVCCAPACRSPACIWWRKRHMLPFESHLLLVAINRSDQIVCGVLLIRSVDSMCRGRSHAACDLLHSTGDESDICRVCCCCCSQVGRWRRHRCCWTTMWSRCRPWQPPPSAHPLQTALGPGKLSSSASR
jgi:hypothetical protein